MSSLLHPQPPPNPWEDAGMYLKDTSVAQSSIAIFGGYPMGCALSLFGSFISAETSTQCMGTKDFFKYSLKNAHKLGYQFAFFGFVFGGMEIAMEKRRGKKDVWNATVAGGALGAFYGYRSYRIPGFIGGTIGGGVLSIVFEYLMHAAGMAQK